MRNPDKLNNLLVDDVFKHGREVKSLAQDKMPNVDHQTSQLPKFWSAQLSLCLAKMIQINNRFLFWLNKFGQLAILPNGLKNYVFLCFLLANFHKRLPDFSIGF